MQASLGWKWKEIFVYWDEDKRSRKRNIDLWLAKSSNFASDQEGSVSETSENTHYKTRRCWTSIPFWHLIEIIIRTMFNVHVSLSVESDLAKRRKGNVEKCSLQSRYVIEISNEKQIKRLSRFKQTNPASCWKWRRAPTLQLRRIRCLVK